MTDDQFEKLTEILKDIQKQLANHSEKNDVITEIKSLARLVEQQTKVIEKIHEKDKPYTAYDELD